MPPLFLTMGSKMEELLKDENIFVFIIADGNRICTEVIEKDGEKIWKLPTVMGLRQSKNGSIPFPQPLLVFMEEDWIPQPADHFLMTPPKKPTNIVLQTYKTFRAFKAGLTVPPDAGRIITDVKGGGGKRGR